MVCVAEKVERTVKIEASTVEIEERGVKLRLTVVDTPGFADAIDSTEWCVRQSARSLHEARLFHIDTALFGVLISVQFVCV